MEYFYNPHEVKNSVALLVLFVVKSFCSQGYSRGQIWWWKIQLVEVRDHLVAGHRFLRVWSTIFLQTFPTKGHPWTSPIYDNFRYFKIIKLWIKSQRSNVAQSMFQRCKASKSTLQSVKINVAKQQNQRCKAAKSKLQSGKINVATLQKINVAQTENQLDKINVGPTK